MLRSFQSEPEVPWTTNATQRAIGRMKMRARTVRGYKSWKGMQAVTMMLLIACSPSLPTTTPIQLTSTLVAAVGVGIVLLLDRMDIS